MEHREVQKVDIPITERDPGIIAQEKGYKQSKSHKIIKSDLEEAPETDRHSETDIPPRELILEFETASESLKEFTKIPRGLDLEYLDPVSRYECKIQAILLLQRILSGYMTVETMKDKIGAWSVGKNQDQDTFSGIEIGLFIEILRER